jgi:nucleoside-diphosphate-sugar epimerase
VLVTGSAGHLGEALVRVLRDDAPAVVQRLFPDYAAEYARRGWLLAVLGARAGTVPRALALAGVDQGDLAARTGQALDDGGHDPR